MSTTIQAYLRADGGKGIRNQLLVACLVECAHHVAREIVIPFCESGAQVIGFGGCYSIHRSWTSAEEVFWTP